MRRVPICSPGGVHPLQDISCISLFLCREKSFPVFGNSVLITENATVQGVAVTLEIKCMPHLKYIFAHHIILIRQIGFNQGQSSLIL